MSEKVAGSTSFGIFDRSSSRKLSSESPDRLRVRSIDGIRRSHGVIEYLVQWFDLKETDRTWEPMQHLTNCRAEVLAFHDFCNEQMKSIETADTVQTEILDDNSTDGDNNEEDGISPGTSKEQSSLKYQTQKQEEKKRSSSGPSSQAAKKRRSLANRSVSFVDYTFQTGEHVFVRYGSSQDLYPAIIVTINSCAVQVRWLEGDELATVNFEDIVLVDKALTPGSHIFMFFPGKNHYNEGTILHKNNNDTWDIEIMGRKNKARNVELYRIMLPNEESYTTVAKVSPEIGV